MTIFDCLNCLFKKIVLHNYGNNYGCEKLIETDK